MFRPEGPITMVNATAVLAKGESAVAAGEAAFDLSSLEGSDSSALAVLLAWRRAAASAGRTLKFSGIPEGLIALGRLYGVEAFLPGFPA